MLLVRWVTQSFKHNACPPHYRIKPRMARLLRGCQKHKSRPKAALAERVKGQPSEPSTCLSSPDSYISIMMSEPPMNSPFTYSCGMVGQLL